MATQHAQSKALLRSVRSQNTKLVLRMIREAGEVSRYELAGRIGLSPTTVSKLVGDLISLGFVRELGKGKSSGGRQPVLLTIDRSRRHFLSLYIWQKGVEWSLIDFGFDVVRSRNADLSRRLSRRQFSDLIASNLDICDGCSLLGVGVSVAGVVDRERRVISQVAALREPDFPVASELTRLLDVPVVVENIEGIRAWTEFLASPMARTVICFEADVGVGVGFVIDGRVYRGASGAAGEIGHTIVAPGGPRCSMGHRGCLEALTNMAAFNRDFRKALDRTPHRSEWDQLCKESPACMSIVKEKAELMAGALSCLVDAMDPDLVMLAGAVFSENDVVFECVERLVRSRSFSARRKRLPRIKRAVPPARSTVVGVARLLWHEVYESSEAWSLRRGAENSI